MIHHCPDCRCGNRNVLKAQALELSAAGLPASTVAAEIGTGHRTVLRWLREAGAKVHPRRQKTVEERVGLDAFTAALKAAKGNVATVARTLKCSKPGVYSALERLGLRERDRVPQRATKRRSGR